MSRIAKYFHHSSLKYDLQTTIKPIVLNITEKHGASPEKISCFGLKFCNFPGLSVDVVQKITSGSSNCHFFHRNLPIISDRFAVSFRLLDFE